MNTFESGPDDTAPHQSAAQRAAVMLAPSLISADWWHAGAVVDQLTEAGCEWLHFDAMDGHFVPNLTLGPLFLKALRQHSRLHFDAHLMLSNSGDYLQAFIDAGADSISVHVEGNPHLHSLITRIKEGGALAGVVLNPGTPVAALDAILPHVGMVLVMSVNPGFSGQNFLPLAVAKIEQLHRLRVERGLDFLIEVDGGVSPQTAPAAVRAGADVLVAANSIFNSGHSLAQSVSDLRQAIAGALH